MSAEKSESEEKDVSRPASTAPCSSKSKKVSKDRKIKTEPANSFGQYIKYRKKESIENNPKDKLDMKDVRKKWSIMSDVEKAFFKDCYMKEKHEMGTNYRMNRKRKVKENLKKRNPEVKKLAKNVKVQKETETEEFLVKLQLCDKNIEESHNESKVWCEELSCEKITNAVMKYKLKMKKEELDALKDKYEHLVLQHNQCHE